MSEIESPPLPPDGSEPSPSSLALSESSIPAAGPRAALEIDWPYLAALGVGLGITFGPVLAWLFDRWMTDKFYSHGPLVAGGALYFAWQQWGELANADTRGDRRAVWILAGAALLEMGVVATGVMTAGAIALLVTLIGLVVLYRGIPGLRLMSFPLFLFFFSIPTMSAGSEASGLILTPMMEIAASTTAKVTNALGLVAQVSGTIVRYKNYTMQIIAPCSGMSSLVSLMPLGALLGHFNRSRSWQMLVLVAAAVPIAFVANVTRLTLTALLGVNFGAKVASGFLHDLSGVFTFLLGAMLMVAVSGARWLK